MKTTFQDLKNHYSEMLKEEKKMQKLFDKAENLTNNAKIEFINAFSLDFALDGEIYIGSEKSLNIRFPNIKVEAKKLKIKLVLRS